MAVTRTPSAYVLWLGVVGFFLSALAYTSRIWSTNGHMFLLLGTFFVVFGYLCLGISRLQALQEKKQKGAVYKRSDIWFTIGSVSLCVFFALSLVLPAITFHKHWYDVFGLIGYAIAVFLPLLPSWAGNLPLVVYYVLSTEFKLFHTDLLDWMQLVSRVFLFLYYALKIEVS